MYNKKQQNLLKHTIAKVRALFANYPSPAHGIKHSEGVVAYIIEIAKKEKARAPYLCELAAWLHDIGRTRDEGHGIANRKHHEFSYEILREWFRDDREFDKLTKAEKKELLYSVRYHWNNAANQYDTAWILRDADKLDGFGARGLKRIIENAGGDKETISTNFRLVYDCVYWLKTKTARDILKRDKMMLPLDKYYLRLLSSYVLPIDL